MCSDFSQAHVSLPFFHFSLRGMGNFHMLRGSCRSLNRRGKRCLSLTGFYRTHKVSASVPISIHRNAWNFFQSQSIIHSRTTHVIFINQPRFLLALLHTHWVYVEFCFLFDWVIKLEENEIQEKNEQVCVS